MTEDRSRKTNPAERGSKAQPVPARDRSHEPLLSTQTLEMLRVAVDPQSQKAETGRPDPRSSGPHTRPGYVDGEMVSAGPAPDSKKTLLLILAIGGFLFVLAAIVYVLWIAAG